MPTLIAAGIYKPTKNVTLYAVYGKTEGESENSISCGWEDGDDATAWEIINFVKYSTSKHSGTNSGSTDSKASGSIQLKNKVSVTNVIFYVSKTTKNTTASNWIVATSADGKQWKEQQKYDAAIITKDQWMQCSVNIATDIPVFVRISYSGSTAVRLIDDISVKAILSTITYSSTPICGIQKTTVSFDSNGGAETVPAQIKEEVGKTVTLPNGDGLSKEGFTFSGWNTKADGTGTAYVAGATYAMTAENVTIHAQWTAQEVEPPYGVLVGANPTAAGSAYVDGEEDKEFDQAGANATITATANPHYRFHDWTIDEGNVIIADAKAATTTIMVQKEKGTVLYANFVSLYPITTTVSGEGTISVVNTTADSYVAEAAEGDKMEVSVTTDDVVKSVTMNGTALTATNGKYTFTMPRGAVTIEATIVEAVKWYVVHDMSLLNAGGSDGLCIPGKEPRRGGIIRRLFENRNRYI